MEFQPEGSLCATGHRGLGVYENREELHDAQPTVTSVIEQGRDDEVRARPEPENAARAEENRPGAEAPRPLDREDHEGVGGHDGGRHEGDGGHEPEPQREEPAPLAAAEGPQAAEGDERRRRRRTVFTPLQLQVLENFFFRTKYPDAIEREELARRLNLNPTVVQVWFRNRRAKWRRYLRAMLLRNVAPVAFGHPMGPVFNWPYNPVPVRGPVWGYAPMAQQPFGPLMPQGPPVLPELFMPPMPPAPRMPPMPPFGQAPVGMAWAPVVNRHFAGPMF